MKQKVSSLGGKINKVNKALVRVAKRNTEKRQQKKTPTAPKMLELINDFRDFSGYKINTQRSITFLSGNNECMETNYKHTMPLELLQENEIFR